MPDTIFKRIKEPSVLLPQQYIEPPLSNSPERTVGLHLTDILLNSQVRARASQEDATLH